MLLFIRHSIRKLMPNLEDRERIEKEIVLITQFLLINIIKKNILERSMDPTMVVYDFFFKQRINCTVAFVIFQLTEALLCIPSVIKEFILDNNFRIIRFFEYIFTIPARRTKTEIWMMAYLDDWVYVLYN